jgi:acetyl/propionyl-CoA carboxylase alpha subunit
VAIRAVLIANRGEIAVRIARTCRALGIESIAVRAPDDAEALHVRSCDRCVDVPSYLDAAAIAEAARSAGADAVHPGYGFLSERGDAARAVEAAGVRWIGPPPDVLDRTGDKLEAKAIAAAAGVPVLPQGDPAEVGYPLILKAAAGGGGRGMRVVRDADGLEEARRAAEREAEAAFGDGRIYAERLVERPRHVEVQILADVHGGAIALGERDCSVQRRHQKVLEEAPSPAVDPHLRERLEAAAVGFARAAGYVGAGTAEFLVEPDGALWFLELNARIQVEHPVTELVTGVDLVAEQIRIADGGAVGAQPAVRGHAMEVRLYAEDPLSFLPRTGTLRRLVLPEGVRCDVGIAEGDAVPAAYDPMIAKLIAHGDDRAEALSLLTRALDEVEVRGTVTNLAFLRWLVRQPDVVRGDATTAFLDENPPLGRRRRPAGPYAGAWRIGGGPAGRLPVPQEPERSGAAAGDGRLIAPMPGVVLEVAVAAGATVAAGDLVAVLEAMKMEHRLEAPHAGVVREVAAEAGAFVDAGAVLAVVEPV